MNQGVEVLNWKPWQKAPDTFEHTFSYRIWCRIVARSIREISLHGVSIYLSTRISLQTILGEQFELLILLSWLFKSHKPWSARKIWLAVWSVKKDLTRCRAFTLQMLTFREVNNQSHRIRVRLLILLHCVVLANFSIQSWIRVLDTSTINDLVSFKSLSRIRESWPTTAQHCGQFSFELCYYNFSFLFCHIQQTIHLAGELSSQPLPTFEIRWYLNSTCWRGKRRLPIAQLYSYSSTVQESH